jgi:hypothetical protein
MGILTNFKKIFPILLLMGIVFTACNNDENDNDLVIEP